MPQPIAQTRITLKNLKVAAFLSEETLAFEATVCLDGERVAVASNNGHGGSTAIHALPGKGAALEAATAFAKSLPPTVTEFDDPRDPTKKFVIPASLDNLVDGLALDQHHRKRAATRLKRLMKRSIVLIEGVRILTVTPPDTARLAQPAYLTQVATRNPNARVLNGCPPTEALAVFVAHGG